ncbi:MAG: hypothetical protein LBM93_11940 [Oscillospiraceae bacterium]|jgi:hypothetical protein|nr:hypothetical protein [Oscillospiraceae bacterium]
MKIKYYVLIWVLTFAVGFLILKNYKDDMIDIDYSKIEDAIVRIYDCQIYENDLEHNNTGNPELSAKDISLSELTEKSDVVVKVKALRSVGRSDSALTTVKTITRYKGEPTDEFNVYECGELTRQEIYSATAGYIVMLPDKEYTLFLKNWEDPYTGEKAYLLTNVYYGKIYLNSDKMEVMDTETDFDTTVFSRYVNWGIIPISEQILENYTAISDEVRKWEK